MAALRKRPPYETIMKINGGHHWVFAAVNPETNEVLHVGVYTARSTMSTKLFLLELEEKYGIEDVEFFVDGAPWLHAGLLRA